MHLISRLREEWSTFTPLKADVTNLLYRQSITVQLIAYLLAILLALATLNTGATPSHVYLWLVLIFLVYLGRAILTISHSRTKSLNISWLNRFRIASIITGVAWASATVLLLEPSNMLNQSITLFILTGLCAAVALSYAIDYFVLFGFLTPILLALFSRFAYEGSIESTIMSVLPLLFLAFISIMVRKANKVYVNNFNLAAASAISETREKSYSRIMEMIANNVALDSILEAIVLNLEKQDSNMLCSILLLDKGGKHLRVFAAPSLPDFYNQAIDGIEIGADIGCCGAAAFSGKRIIVEDILHNPNWKNHTELAIKANLRACWSEPIKDATGVVLGTFAIYHRKPTSPTEKDIQTITHYAALTGIAIGLANNYQEQRLAALLYQNTSESMMITDSDHKIIAVNPAFTKDTGYSAEEAIGNNPNILNSGRQDDDFYQHFYHALNTDGEWQGEVWNRRKNGDIYPQWIRVSTIYDDEGAVLNRVCLATDVSKRKESEDTIWRQANVGTLTGLPNRRMFQEQFQQAIKKSQRANLPLALLFIDLDEFKEVNDAFGHHMGDVLLKETAQRLSNCIRESDTTSRLDPVARLGGDEFTIILSELKDIECIERITQRILANIAEPYHLGEELVYISASIGITLYPEDAADIETLLKNADQAMYAAKREGKNRVSYFTSSMQANVLQRMQLTKDLRVALAEQQFQLVYQPIVNLKSKKIYKAEALIRWQHPKGLVSPADFIPIAESTGLINEIGNWIFLEAIAQAKVWRQSLAPNFQISINKSPVQFQHHAKNDGKNYLNWPKYIQENDIPGASIAVEITEGLLLDTSEELHQHLLEFRDAGIQVALDDFGTGYSSLSYLKKLDIDYLKIDQSFVQNLGPDSDDIALCQAIIVMAHKLKLKVIAEGIETQEQLDLLRDAGCDFGQGYFFSKPLAPADFEKVTIQFD